LADQTRRLLAGARQGDRGALEALLDRLRPRLVLWVGARLSERLRREADPEDVVQEILLAVHEGLPRFRGEDERAFLSWLFTVAENRIRDLADYVGAEKRQRRDPVHRSQTSPSAAAARGEMIERLAGALECIPEDYREVIRLRRFEGLDTARIAARMRRSENAVRLLYFRGIRTLQREMGAQGETNAR
jgi:RNA polymerase sigma-70 factor (ECF subfamily)